MKPSELFYEKFLENANCGIFPSRYREHLQAFHKRILSLERIYRNPQDPDAFLLANLLDEVKHGDLNRINRVMILMESIYNSNVAIWEFRGHFTA